MDSLITALARLIARREERLPSRLKCYWRRGLGRVPLCRAGRRVVSLARCPDEVSGFTTALLLPALLPSG